MAYRHHDGSFFGQAAFAAALQKNQQANSPGLALSGRAMQALQEGKTVTVLPLEFAQNTPEVRAEEKLPKPARKRKKATGAKGSSSGPSRKSRP